MKCMIQNLSFFILNFFCSTLFISPLNHLLTKGPTLSRMIPSLHLHLKPPQLQSELMEHQPPNRSALFPLWKRDFITEKNCLIVRKPFPPTFAREQGGAWLLGHWGIMRWPDFRGQFTHSSHTLTVWKASRVMLHLLASHPNPLFSGRALWHQPQTSGHRPSFYTDNRDTFMGTLIFSFSCLDFETYWILSRSMFLVVLYL